MNTATPKMVTAPINGDSCHKTVTVPTTVTAPNNSYFSSFLSVHVCCCLSCVSLSIYEPEPQKQPQVLLTAIGFPGGDFLLDFIWLIINNH